VDVPVIEEVGDQSVTPKRRRPRNPRQTEASLFAAVDRLLTRDGILAGLNLQEVAEEAGVNRGQIYQIFGSRRGLLRAALLMLLQEQEPDRTAFRSKTFKERRRLIFESMLQRPGLVGLEALLALDGDEDLAVLPEFTMTLENLKRDKEEGALPPDADGAAIHVATAAIYMGYCIFRETLARDTNIPLQELDERVLKVYDGMLSAMTAGSAADVPSDPLTDMDAT